MFAVFDRVTFTEIWGAGLPEVRHAIFCTYVKEITIYEYRLEVEFVNVHRFKIRWDEVGHKKGVHINGAGKPARY